MLPQSEGQSLYYKYTIIYKSILNAYRRICDEHTLYFVIAFSISYSDVFFKIVKQIDHYSIYTIPIGDNDLDEIAYTVFFTKEKCLNNKQVVLHGFTGSLLQYFFSHHFTECKGDPRAHHEEVEVLRAPKNVFNSV